MRYTILFSIFLFTTFISCKKDKFSTTPSLKFEKVNTKNLHPGEVITFTLSFTYKGDLTGSVFVQEMEPTCVGSNFTDTYPVPSFSASKNEKGEITVTFGYNSSNSSYTNISPKCQRNDTATFRFALIADSSHVSDTVSSPPVVIYNQ